ncbi:fucose-binding lectin II [Kitasatospora sp. NPDC098663]|uniref:fucose-binding lectin II n=1 Tax=Kitasatospora sp. NPDC098663 TaxID=3364096 RepID=UPI0037F6F806
MSEQAYTYTKVNTAEISLPAGVTVQVKAKSNSKLTQKVTLKSKDGSVDTVFSGTGEKNAQLGETTITTGESFLLHAVFEFAGDDGVFQPSKLNSGGPYEIGRYNMLVVVAENGDDSDYNDTILEFSWNTK